MDNHRRFRGKPDLDQPNLLEEFRKINFHNLVYPIVVPVIHDLARQKPEEYRECLRFLFNESELLEKRVKEFISRG